MPGITNRSIYRKIQQKLIPFLVILYIFAYLDRINISFAALQMSQQLGFTDSVYGLGAGLFFIGYFIFEVPSNLILERTGAKIWISRIMVSWGIVACCMIFIRNEHNFYLLRFILGIAEAGFFPGIIFYLTKWFTEAQRAQSMALFTTATAISGIIGGPLSGWILSFHGIAGLPGWQWLFLVEGIPAIFLGILVLFILPNSPKDVHWLSSLEKEQLLEQLQAENKANQHIKKHSLVEIFTSPRVWGLSFIYFTICVGIYGFSLWLPQLIKGASNLNNLQIGLVSAIPYLVAAIGMVSVGAHSDLKRERKWHIVFLLMIAGLGFGLISLTQGLGLTFLGLLLVAFGVWSSIGIFWSVPNYLLGNGTAAGGIALINSVGNLGGFFGPSLIGFFKDQTGSFADSLLILMAIMILGAIATLLIVPNQYHTNLNVRNDKNRHHPY